MRTCSTDASEPAISRYRKSTLWLLKMALRQESLAELPEDELAVSPIVLQVRREVQTEWSALASELMIGPRGCS